MNKKVQKGLVAAVAATMGASIVAPAVQAATVDLATQYAQAYAAYEKAAKSKDQKDLTEARALLDALYARVKGTKEEYLATTLTSLLDPVQQSKFEFIIAVTKTKVEEVEQKNINEGKYNFNNLSTAWQKWFEAYSSALDTVQQGYYEHVLNLVKNAKTQAELDAAKVKFADLMTMNHSDTVKAVYEKNVKAEVEKTQSAIDEVNAALKVASISAVNGTNGEVALDGATNVQRNATFKMVLSHDFDKNTVSNNTIKVMKGNDIVAITTPKTYQKEITFSTFATLDSNSEYKIVVDGIKAADGKTEIKSTTVATFKTSNQSVVKNVVAMDNGSAVGAIYNYDGTGNANVAQTWVNTQDAFNITFDEAIDATTLNSSTVQLVDVTTGKSLAVEAKRAKDLGGNDIVNQVEVKIVGVNDFLMPKDRYELRIKGVKTSSSVEVAPFTVQFSYQESKPIGITATEVTIGSTSNHPTTGNSAVNLVNPTLNPVLLSDKTTYAEGAKLVADFGASNVKLDVNTVNTDNFYVRTKNTKEKVAVNVKYVDSLNRVEVTPAAPLKEATEYELCVGPYVKNIYGIAKGLQDTDIDVVPFKTLDVTAPVIEKVEGSLNNLQVGKDYEVKVYFSESIASISENSAAYANFVSGAGNGNVAMFRADDNSNAESLMTQKLSNDGKVLTITVSPTEAARGKSYRVMLAGYHPSRTASSMITDKADQFKGMVQLTNRLATDYTFGLSVEGNDVTAPKVVEAKGTVVAGTEVELNGATNINGSIKIKLDDKVANIAPGLLTKAAYGTVEFKYNYNNAGVITPKTDIVTLGAGSYSEDLGNAIITVATSSLTQTPVTPVEMRLTGVKDNAGNEISTFAANFSVGNGPKVNKVEIKDVNGKAGGYVATPSTSDKSAFKVTFAAAVDKATVTNATVKLMDGTTEIPVELDKDALDASNYVVLKPTAAISGSKKYTVVVTKDVKDLVGNALQQISTLAPADYKVDLMTMDDAKPAVKAAAVYEAGKVTIAFENKLGSVGASTITNTVTGLTVGNTAAINADDATKLEIKLTSGVSKNVNYKGVITVTGTNGQVSVINYDFTPAANWSVPVAQEKDKPTVAIVKASGSDADSKITLTFTDDADSLNVAIAGPELNKATDLLVNLAGNVAEATGVSTTNSDAINAILDRTSGDVKYSPIYYTDLKAAVLAADGEVTADLAATIANIETGNYVNLNTVNKDTVKVYDTATSTFVTLFDASFDRVNAVNGIDIDLDGKADYASEITIDIPGIVEAGKSKQYIIQVTTGVKDAVGNVLKEQTEGTLTFTVAP